MRRTTAIVAALVTMLPCATAVAQTPAGDAYGGDGQTQGEVINVNPGGEVQGDQEERTEGTPAGETLGQTSDTSGSPTARAASASSSEDGSLPFTGLDVLLIVAGGLALIAAGATIRRLTPPAPRL